MTQFNNAAVFAIFDAAEEQSVSLATQLMELGIGCRADAEPFCMAWASKKYSASIRKGQRGEGFDRGTKQGNAAYMAVYRVLNFLYAVPREGSVVKAEKAKPKFDAEKAAKQLKAKYTKAQLEKILAAW
jgi:hypothetical protein